MVLFYKYGIAKCGLGLVSFTCSLLISNFHLLINWQILIVIAYFNSVKDYFGIGVDVPDVTPKVDAASPTAEGNRKDKIAVGDESESDDESESGKEVTKKKSSKVGFRDRKVGPMILFPLLMPTFNLFKLIKWANLFLDY